MSRPARPPRRALGAALIALAIAAPGACRRDPPPGGAPTAAPGPSAAGPLAAPSDSAARPRSARLDDPRWRLAAADDPLERARLAQAEGAAGLLDALDDGGDIAVTALRALPDAPDADIALGPLAARALAAASPPAAPAAPPADLELLLRTLLEIAGRPAPSREPLDPEGARAAAAALVQIARRRELPPAPRALAVSAARALAARGYLDPSEIPADLDPG